MDEQTFEGILELYERHFHDLLNDLGREQVRAEVTEWLTTHSRGT